MEVLIIGALCACIVALVIGVNLNRTIRGEAEQKGLSVEELMKQRAETVKKVAEAGRKRESWFGIGFATFFVITFVCMLVGMAIMSQDGMGGTFRGQTFITEKGISVMMWTRGVMEIMWGVAFFIVSCKAVKSSGVNGFRRCFWGTVSGAVLAGIAFGIVSAFY